MYLKNFDLNKYDKQLYWISDLCVSDKSLIISDSLKGVHTKHLGFDRYFILEYDTTLLKPKELSYMLYRFKQESNIYNVSTTLQNNDVILVITYIIPKYNVLDYDIRIKYGLKYETTTSLKRLMKFWGEYNIQLFP